MATSGQAGCRLGWEGILSVLIKKGASYEIQRTGKMEARPSEAVTKARQPHEVFWIAD